MTDSASGRAREVKLNRALASLTDREREALHRFYNCGDDIAKISRELGFREGEFQKLKSRVRDTFFGAKKSQ